FADALLEKDLGGRFDAVGPVAKVDDIEVAFEDLVFGVFPLDLDGQQQLFKLARPGAVVGEKSEFGQLLRDGAPALLDGAGAQIDQGGACDAEKVDAVMLVEVGILGGDESEPDDLGNFVKADGNSIFSKKAGDDPSFHVVNVGGQFGVKIDLVKGRDAAEVPRHHAGHGPDRNGDGKREDDNESSAPWARAGLSAQRTDTSVQGKPDAMGIIPCFKLLRHAAPFGSNCRCTFCMV